MNSVVLDYDFDDALIDAINAGASYQLRVYQPQDCFIVLGRGSKIEQEIDLLRCQRDAIPIYRRRGGGCTVVLDPGNLIVSIALGLPGFGNSKQYLDRITAWLVDAFHTLGFGELRAAGISDMAIGEHKISGSCVYRSRGLLYYSASILVEADLSRLDRYLLHPPREPDYRRQRKHSDFVRQLSLGKFPSIEALKSALFTELNKTITSLLDEVDEQGKPLFAAPHS